MPKFNLDFDPRYGELIQVSPLIRRIVAPNPSMFTFKGTGTYIVGKRGRDIAIIDPGPDMESHIDALKYHLKGEKVSHILITHNHSDHSPAATAVKDYFGAEVFGFDPTQSIHHAKDQPQGVDCEITIDHYLKDGDVINGQDWQLEALHTPGHISNHLCFALSQENALFTGDHVMGWSTSVILPPDGDMGAYMDGLERIRQRSDDVFYPTHGAPIYDPQEFTVSLINHRKKREEQILAALELRPVSLTILVRKVYVGLAEHLYPAAQQSLLAHLIHLERQKKIIATPTVAAPKAESFEYRLTS